MKLEELKALEAAATPGPWTNDGRDIRGIYPHFSHRIAYASTAENGAFIAAARTMLPRLIAVVAAVIEEEAALDACDRHEAGAPARHSAAFRSVKDALAALEAE